MSSSAEKPTQSSTSAAVSVDESQIRESMRRCSEETIQAAIAYRRTKDPVHTMPVVTGILARYVDPELRPRLAQDGEALRFVEDLALDSLTMMEIVMLVEEVTGLTISNAELKNLATVGDIRTFIDCKAHGEEPTFSKPAGGANDGAASA